jgi:hypothetical protein
MKCPICKERESLQIRMYFICKEKESLQINMYRKIFFKLLPFSKRYKCHTCESRYINWLSIQIPYKIEKERLQRKSFLVE